MKKINCILLIDDNPADNEYHRIIIEEADVCRHIKVMTSGAKALDYLSNADGLKPEEDGFCPTPDLIFLDINMPGMSGFEFLEKYSELKAELKSSITVVMLTTSLNPDDQKRGLAHPEIKDFQNKPLTVESIRETIEKYFQ